MSRCNKGSLPERENCTKLILRRLYEWETRCSRLRQTKTRPCHRAFIADVEHHRLDALTSEQLINNMNLDPKKQSIIKAPSRGVAKARSNMASRALASVHKTTITNSIGVKLKLIPAGEFLMGSPLTEVGREEYEGQHSVKISKPFFIGVYQVTQGQYQKVMGNNRSEFGGENNPVEMVSWNDAKNFCSELSALPKEKAAGHSYRLPTEAEWEYACRAGTHTRFPFGDRKSDLSEYAWYDDNSAENTEEMRTTRPVGGKLPNAWGLYDMHGNVWEWCEDWFGPYPADPGTDPTGPMSGSTPKGPATGSTRVLRGGSWNHFAASCRSADRYWNFPSYRSFSVGFRISLIARNY